MSRSKAISFFLFLFSFFSIRIPVFAQCAAPGERGGCGGVDTAIGRISTDPAGLIGNILAILLSISGGIAIILIIAAGYQLVTSRGNPEKVKEARERITSAITGLLLIIFSVLILQIIGFDLLHLPGFNR
ncbi:MAG TPA: hypothetical protein VEW42_05050 [Candidatus Eisenbacteria bacterium]|nr:hypothetical protein [Candidatus Eisenbacteria bacterium]